MKFLVAAITFGFIAWVFVQHFRQRPVAGPQERFFNFRAWTFSALVAFLFLLAFVFLPDKGRVLMLVPVFLVGMGLNKWIRKNRARLRQEEAERTNFERARRIN